MTGRGRGATAATAGRGASEGHDDAVMHSSVVGSSPANASSTPDPSCIPHRLLSDAQLADYAALCREVGGTATWIVSSAKYGNGVHQLRDDNPETFWQSDGALPHMVRVEFPRLTAVHAVAVCLSFASDESYTPAKLSVRAGTHENDIAEVATIETTQPNGWILQTIADDSTTVSSLSEDALRMDIKYAMHAISKTDSVATLARCGLALMPVYCTVLQLLVPENHQQGRDTHVRGIKVFGPPLPTSEKMFGGFESLR